ncbi:MAG: hypothetical protein K9G67_16015 [Bacteroidales bacterium]|nr:hypothetical protein [Bacteroidales bacterium]MCF8345298.1 hypothetical protein [Bacteroidales bacterium]MCF8352663.1 hypothetical protein [Bacteroidales bacterium]MCF8377862.1 hypothetical protein [Bacteroidales bacterium]
MKKLAYICLVLICPAFNAYAQNMQVSDPYLILNAGPDDPLYTTYTAPIERARLYGDKGYKMDHYTDENPLNYGSDEGGRIYNIWMVNKLVIPRMSEYHKRPVVKASFSDMALLEYEPFEGIHVEECFNVYSSRLAIVDMNIKNTSGKTQEIELFPVLDIRNDSMRILGFDEENNAYVTEHHESLERLISDLYAGYGYPTQLRDVFSGNFEPYSYGGFRGNLNDFYNYIKTDFYAETRYNDSLNFQTAGDCDFVSLHFKFSLEAGEEKNIRYTRGVQSMDEDIETLMNEVDRAMDVDLQKILDRNVEMFRSVPRIRFDDPQKKMVYLGAFNLARGCMLPPSGKTSYNFYVFSREPLWGWGHGHQVLHESLAMMAYAYLDAQSAQNSQRVYMEQQRADGLIAYRHGPRGMQDYPHYSKIYGDTMSTTSAPFYSWINWEIFRVSHDTSFLEDAYLSGSLYTEWLVKNRDADRDGLFEWGPYGIIENVRDWYNAVFQVSAERYLDVDKEDISDELECLDLSMMLSNEMQHLSKMAKVLGKEKEAGRWQKQAEQINKKVNRYMWDDSSGFYYSVNRDDHGFMFMTRDLRRQEIIGFLPLWTNAAPEDRAKVLLESLTDSTKFWRQYGIPTLAADDPWYSPYVDYCCKWNGPVWLLWDYMVFKGLLNYGEYETAEKLADKMYEAVQVQLSKNHNFWESYSPDNQVLNCPSNYIWDAIMAKVFIDLEEARKH